jgi:flagellar motor protein MotB
MSFDLVSRKGLATLLVVSFGESSPMADNGIREGRDKNRRVEIRVFSEVITTSSAMTTARR